jgi:hypothetical protein
MAESRYVIALEARCPVVSIRHRERPAVARSCADIVRLDSDSRGHARSDAMV